ncbi:hypothetical protein DESC_720064 [Desulfosarcina cetonica]|nr:hypothetical protein DESC_720064 [Desulfosarcina cetonica]
MGDPPDHKGTRPTAVERSPAPRRRQPDTGRRDVGYFPVGGQPAVEEDERAISSVKNEPTRIAAAIFASFNLPLQHPFIYILWHL